MIKNRPKPNTGTCSHCPHEWQSEKCKEFHKSTYSLETMVFILLALFIFLYAFNSEYKKPSLYQEHRDECIK